MKYFFSYLIYKYAIKYIFVLFNDLIFLYTLENHPSYLDIKLTKNPLIL